MHLWIDASAGIAGDMLLGALIGELETQTDDAVRKDVDEAVGALLEAISDVEGLNTLMMLLLGWCAAGRRTSCTGAACAAGPAPRCTGSRVTSPLLRIGVVLR